MSTDESLQEDELLDIIQSKPAEAIRKHADLLERVARDSDRERFRAIAAWALEEYADREVEF
jgi:hypothetical protein